MKITPELAEIAGAFAADGCLQKGYLCMWGNITEDREYYDKHLVPLFEGAFNITLRAHEKRSNSVYGFYLCNRQIVKLFNEQFSFPVGKKTYTVSAPNIIKQSSDEIKAAFIRGYTDCDGSLNFHKRYGKGYSVFNRTFHVYPRIHITSVSQAIINDISYMLDSLNIKHSLEKQCPDGCKKRKAFAHILTVRGTNRLKNWMNIIGFNNPAQFTKYLTWKKYGFCPANTNLKERKEMLIGSLNPEYFYK